MIAGELESLDRFQLMERCRMLVGIFEKVALYEFGIEVWDGLDAWEMPKKTAYDHPSGPPCRARLDLVENSGTISKNIAPKLQMSDAVV